uniref:Uncharacterized protein n=1 Tax=Arundo donax TaxID=35708 RepID=A0A0A9CUT7_ARUDO
MSIWSLVCPLSNHMLAYFIDTMQLLLQVLHRDYFLVFSKHHHHGLQMHLMQQYNLLNSLEQLKIMLVACGFQRTGYIYISCVRLVRQCQ